MQVLTQERINEIDTLLSNNPGDLMTVLHALQIEQNITNSDLYLYWLDSRSHYHW